MGDEEVQQVITQSHADIYIHEQYYTKSCTVIAVLHTRLAEGKRGTPLSINLTG